MQSIALNRNDEPTKPKLSDEQVEALRDALLILRTPCVFNHLMSVSPDTDVTILSSPLQQMHSLTMECGATFNQTNTKHSKSNIVSSESMVIPAYSKNGFNFGFMVAESYALISKEFATMSNGVSTSRFVTRESDGTLIATVRTNLVDILVCFQARNRSCTCYDFIFPTGALAPLIRSTTHDDDDLSALQRTICAAMVAENSLPCLSCGASTGQPCGCSIVLKNAKSALDLDAVKQNILRLHFGQMGGKGEYNLYGSNGGSHSIPVDFNVNISPNTRNGCAKKLVDLALEDMFKSMHIGVSRSVEPPTPVLEKSLLNTESHLNFKDGSEDLFQSLNIGAALSLEPPPPPSEKAQANIESNSNLRDDSEIYSGLPHDTTPLFSSSNISSIPDFIDDPLWPWNTTSSMFERQIGNGEPVAFCQQGKSPAGCSIVSSSKQAQPVTMTGDGSSMWPWNTTSASTEKRVENEETLALRLQGQSAVTTTVSNSTSTHPLTMNRGGGGGHSIAKKTNSILRPKSIVPRTVTKKISGECDVPDFDDDEKMRQTEEQVRAWKAYKRKIRNRESAARSNRKRKQRLEIERRKKDTSSG